MTPAPPCSEGLARTGRVITAAAAVMVAVFGAFAISGNRVLEMFGLAMASAVFLDALVVRMLLLPAVLAAARPDDLDASALARPAAPAGRDRGRARAPRRGRRSSRRCEAGS